MLLSRFIHFFLWTTFSFIYLISNELSMIICNTSRWIIIGNKYLECLHYHIESVINVRAHHTHDPSLITSMFIRRRYYNCKYQNCYLIFLNEYLQTSKTCTKYLYSRKTWLQNMNLRRPGSSTKFITNCWLFLFLTLWIRMFILRFCTLKW